MKQGKQLSKLILTVALVMVFFTAPISAAPKFSDVPAKDWYAPYVYDLTEQGIINGVTSTQFAPEGNITREQFVKILAYASGDDLSKYQGKLPFNDCTAQWSETSINWAYTNGVVNGVSATKFGPEENITRQQMATMIYRYTAYKEMYLPRDTAAKAFTDDSKIAGWAGDAVTAMVQANIINGYEDNSFRPENSATRAEAAKMISVFLDKAKAKGVNKETEAAFMEKDIYDFDSDRVLNFDSDPEDNFAVVNDGVDIVKSGVTNTLQSVNETTGTYVFTNIDATLRNLKSGDKLMITGKNPEDCAAVAVGSIKINGATATITAADSELSDFFDYIQLDTEVPLTEDHFTPTKTEGITYLGREAALAPLDSTGLSEVSQSLAFGVNVQKSNWKAEGKIALELTVDATVNYDFELFGDDYLHCDFVTTVTNTNSVNFKFTEKPDAEPFFEIPLGHVDMPLGPTGLIAEGELNFNVDFDGSLEADISSSTLKQSGFHYDSEKGTEKIDEAKSSENKFAVMAKGSVSAGIEADMGLSLVKLLKASVTGEVGLEGNAEAALVGQEANHSCYLCFDGELLRYAESKLKLTTGTGDFKATPVDLTIVRVEKHLRDFYCSFANETANVLFGWGTCPLIGNSGGSSGGDGDETIVAEGTCGDDLRWKLNEFGGLTVFGSGDMTTFGSAKATPWYSHMADITAVTLESGVTSVGNYAFQGASALLSVSLPQGLTVIGEYAFANTGITSLTVPDGVTRVADNAFFRCAELKTASLPDSITELGSGAFSFCTGMTAVNIPGGITTLNEAVFRRCAALTEITIPQTITEIGVDAFNGCDGLTSVKIPYGVTSIGDDAFSQCESLAQIIIPESVKTIGNSAFHSDYALTSLYIPMSVTAIGNWLVGQCNNLTAIEVDEGNPCFEAANGVLFSEDGSLLVAYPPGKAEEHYAIPTYTATIGEGAFCGSANLTSIDIPETVTTIERAAFSCCEALAEVRIPQSITTIQGATFEYCSGLRTVNLPLSVTTIEASAFADCQIWNVYYGGTEADWNNIQIDPKGNGTFYQGGELILSKFHWNAY